MVQYGILTIHAKFSKYTPKTNYKTEYTSYITAPSPNTPLSIQNK